MSIWNAARLFGGVCAGAVVLAGCGLVVRAPTVESYQFGSATDTNPAVDLAGGTYRVTWESTCQVINYSWTPYFGGDWVLLVDTDTDGLVGSREVELPEGRGSPGGWFSCEEGDSYTVTIEAK